MNILNNLYHKYYKYKNNINYFINNLKILLFKKCLKKFYFQKI